MYSVMLWNDCGIAFVQALKLSYRMEEFVLCPHSGEDTKV